MEVYSYNNTIGHFFVLDTVAYIGFFGKKNPRHIVPGINISM